MLFVVVCAIATLACVCSTQNVNTAAFNAWDSSSTTIHQPIARGFHAAQILSTRCRESLMIVFGGLKQGPLATQVYFLNSTWFLDLQLLQWYYLGQEVDALGPSSRAGHSSVLWGGRFVVFGGRSSGRLLNDTWAFALHPDANCSSKHVQGNWTQLNVTCSGLPDCPSPRFGHVAATLNISNSMYVFGGCSGLETLQNFETFSWLSLVDTQVHRLAETPGGGYAWSLVTVEAPQGSPPARFGAAFAAVSDDSILIVSGCAGSIMSASCYCSCSFFLTSLFHVQPVCPGVCMRVTLGPAWLAHTLFDAQVQP
jgi:hypothetical protein